MSLVLNRLTTVRFINNYLLAFSVLASSLGVFGRVFPFDFYVSIYFFEILLFLILVINFKKVLLIITGKKTNRIPIYFIAYMGFSLIISLKNYNIYENLVAFLYFLRLSFYIVVIFFIPKVLEFNKNSKFLKISLICAISFIVTASLYQYFIINSLHVLSYLGWDPHLGRVVSVFLDPPLTATVLFFLIFSVFYYRNSLNKYVSILSLIILFTLFSLTFSRGGFIALFSVFFYILYKKKHFVKYMLVTIVIFFLFFMLFNKNLESQNLLRTTSISSRLDDYIFGTQLLLKNPVFGIGYNNVKAEKNKAKFSKDNILYVVNNGQSAFHSSFLTIAVTTGIVGLCFFVKIFYTLYVEKKILRPIFLFIFVISLFDNILLHPTVLYIIFISSIFLQPHQKNLKKN